MIINSDIKYALRLHKKHIGSTLIAVLTIAFGVAMAAVVFALVDSVLFTDLPVPQGDRIVAIRYLDTASAKGDFPVWSAYFNYHDYDEYRRRATVFEQMGASVAGRSYTFTDGTSAKAFQGCPITANFLDLLRVKPQLGRGLNDADAAKGAKPVVLISDRVWREVFAADPNVLTKTTTIDGLKYEVVGVVPPGLFFPENHHVWMPMASDLSSESLPKTRRAGSAYTVFARLKDGFSLEAAHKECNALAASIADAHPETNGGLRKVRFGKYPQCYRHSLDESDGVLRVMLATACLVLLTICVDVACMLLAINATRMTELNLRFALGATRGRIFGQIMTESFVLAMIGCVVGGVAAAFTSKVFNAYFSEYRSIPFWWDFGLTPKRILFVVGAMLAVGLFSGLLPALAATRRNISTNLKKSEGAISQLLGRKILLRMVVLQVAFTSLLLIGFGNFVGSMTSILNFKINFPADQIYSSSLYLPDEYTTTQRRDFYRVFDEKLSQASFVDKFSYTTRQVFIRPNVRLVMIEGANYTTPKYIPLSTVESVAENYFDVLGLPLVSGESTVESKDYPGERLAIVNMPFVKKYFPNENPVGKRLRVLGGFYRGTENGQPWVRISGVAPEVTGTVTPGGGESVSAAMENEVVYVIGGPSNVSKAPAGHTENSRYQTLFFRLKPGSGSDVAGELINLVHASDPNVSIQDTGTVRENWNVLSSNVRFLRDLFLVFSVGCLGISLIGIAGSISFIVLQRMKEFGLRVSLGALPFDIRRFILWRGTKNVVIGLLIGFIPGYAAFYWVALKSPIINNHPLVYIIPGVAYLATSAAVILSVARKASQVSPMILMREG